MAEIRIICEILHRKTQGVTINDDVHGRYL